MNVVEVFSCSGGMAEGLRRAGLAPSLAFDKDENACASYAQNLGHAPIKMDAHDLLRLVQAGWTPGPIDLFVADPPCTPWSRAGKRKGTEDERDCLLVTCALVSALRPRHFLIANVPGLDDGPNWPIVQRTIGGLARDGYCIDFARLDAADYGVPQHRVRPFWYGHAAGQACIPWPARTHTAPHETATLTIPGEPALRPWVTCREALSHLPPEDLGTPVRLRWRGQNGKQVACVPDAPARVVGTSNLSDGNVLAHPSEAMRKDKPGRSRGRAPRSASHFDEPSHTIRGGKAAAAALFDGPDHRPSRPDAPARTLTRNTHGDGALLAHERHPVNTLDEPSYTVTTKGDGRGAQGACVLAWPWDRPSTGIAADDRLAPPGHKDRDFAARSLPNAIKLSEKAAAILQGFPEGWTFAGETKATRWSQIGQAMPPPLAEAVAKSIAKHMGVGEGARVLSLCTALSAKP
jgi:site-specific DNA-cytosine methylase